VTVLQVTTIGLRVGSDGSFGVYKQDIEVQWILNDVSAVSISWLTARSLTAIMM